jgi:hypothetical protein
MVRKADMKAQAWIKAYEDWNVDIGLACGLPGQGADRQGHVGHARPDGTTCWSRRSAPKAGANCAWVPSPTAATLHATHYHASTSPAAGRDRGRPPRRSARRHPHDPAGPQPNWSPAEIVQAELENNAQGILGYVVRWVDQGVGCSKVPDINDVGPDGGPRDLPHLLAAHRQLAAPRRGDARAGDGDDEAHGGGGRQAERRRPAYARWRRASTGRGVQGRLRPGVRGHACSPRAIPSRCCRCASLRAASSSVSPGTAAFSKPARTPSAASNGSAV